ncbi:helix-turn-helix transcriptional regulator [Rhodovulum sulfidophilum]|uniref:Transcriptional regulator n=1 Tax=Rhodovulum sulfidophilum TaxID=35806 RepID=A0A0D6B342_RHOSU|nr:XRE family transcriptional regulator [Rhodovulum sulfidophilum]ANB34912.1 transcriptional regulator [Rhodovulum sulfidophilum DSM 1374]ANB38734.1 transcriptional regulator [Rhodovulum sulfidophilum]MBK5923469.1 XRE family transcriptional regulator [Rhodovulum sulfidophilum]MBL3551292.1 helix-turn-helix transcriptional regulator [Rhodovulum sulfidophilum]MBL3562601.1 helix-turn-helix transcriptional regulator [Rhodovulum sulfidophilum]
MAEEREHSLIRIIRAEREAEAAEPLDLGRRVRELRSEKGWTLEQAARHAGLARSTLSKIENDQMSPTYDALKKLATGLGVSVPQLFTPMRGARAGGRMAVTRTGEGAAHATATYEHELMAGALARKRMMPYRTRIRARDIGEFDGWVRHEGEEFLYVLTGVARLYTEFYAPVDMRRGDSAYYDATMGHNLVSISQEDATILWVTSVE